MTSQENQESAASQSHTNQVSSPASTGGAGTFFEQHVSAYWLAQLLVNGIPPILIDTVLLEVKFQTEHLGWQTDDFLIVCERPGAATQKLVGQVKRSFTISAADDDCKAAIQDFWEDFKSSERFSSADDRLVLVTLRGTDILLRHFVGLLDCARAARDSEEFEHRLATNGFISKKAVMYCSELQKIIGDLEGQFVTAADIWPFLRVLHLLSLDLDTSTRQTEAQLKSLLAHTATTGDAVGAADTTWNALLVIASSAMSEAHSLQRTDLPEELQSRHGSIGANDQQVLKALKDHTGVILRGIRSIIGQNFHLKRAALVQEVLSKLETAQVVLISGPAGVGKSAIGKDIIALLSRDHFTFGFRVEEFAQPHFDATLLAGQIPANATALGAILAGQGRKVILVESVERLLEKITRDAFSDLMTLVAGDSGMRVILTCRDYSIDLVRTSFLQASQIKHTVVTVPPLEDTELEEVEAALPALVHPLKNPALRNILRNPYFLDRALEIPWSSERPVPESEREFRTLFWREIVRADHRVPEDVARQRGEVFTEVALRRARALSAYITSSDLDPAVIASLRQDSLISSPKDNPTSVATAHDVLEDWAILHWLEAQRTIGVGSFQELSVAIGSHPAVRRSYRKWVVELVERDPDFADWLFKEAVAETEVTGQFRDDTLISLLKAPSSPDFLLQHESQLAANDRAILKRVIHLLRVACVTTPAWLADAKGHGSIFNVPDGPAWATVLNLVYHNLENFTPQERPLLLGLIEDAVRNVSWWAPDIEGAEFVAGIGHSLLAGFDIYGSSEPRKRVLHVIAKIPNADAVRFEAVLRGAVKEGERRDRIADELRELIFSGLDGMPAARDLPDVVISVATDHLLATEEDFQRDRYSRSSREIETLFGIKDGLRHDFFPASAFRGPWIPLLRHHQHQGLDFVIMVFNHSVDWYINPRVHDSLESAWQIELTFEDGNTQKQWANPRLWNLYRGTSVGPYVLQSMLMALENWLLEFADEYPQQLDGVLVDILRRSDSAALTAVVASVSTAYPHLSGDTLLVLLSAPDIIALDRTRMAGEHQTTALSSMLPQFRADHKVFNEERKQADNLAHRSQDLESAITNLQLGPIAPRVHAILDRHRATLPPKADQSDEDREWRLAMHRMDLRQYTIAEMPAPDEEATAEEPSQRLLRFEPNEPESDIKEMMDEAAARLDTMNVQMNLHMWAYHVFKRENAASYNPTMWPQRLLEAGSTDIHNNGEAGIDDVASGGPGIVAAVCIRDHWEEMSISKRGWCLERTCSEVLAHANEWSDIERVQRFDMAADRACARVLPLLLGKSISEAQQSIVEEAFAAALTHPIDEVRWFTVWGISDHLWPANPELAMRCVNAVAMEATLTETEWQAQDDVPYDKRKQIGAIRAEAAMAVRLAYGELDGIASSAYEMLDVGEPFGSEANARILTILSNATHDSTAITGFIRTAQMFVEWWDADDGRDRGSRRRERNLEAETALSSRLQDFTMRTGPESAKEILEPILDAIGRHPGEIHWIVQGLTAIEDSRPNTEQYWYLWELFADGVKKAEWVNQLDREHPIGRELVHAVFLSTWWKEEVRHWRSLEGHAHKVHALFETLPSSSLVLDDYVRFLYHIGERSLPEAFVRVANSLMRGEVQAMLKKTNTVFLLEVLLQRHVYGRPLELKRVREIREAVLYLLDTLVDNGSPAAFRMRDDFATPAPL